jgi:hypothetical protein
MKTNNTSSPGLGGTRPRRGHALARLAGALLVLGVAGIGAQAQGLPQAARDNIHRLFDQHSTLRRSVTLTETGYTALTESDDPQLAQTLRSHVAQMRERLESGLAVRRWDPAYEEMVRHYKDLELQVEPTPKGLRVVMTGRTPAAVNVAQNHAGIVSKFIEVGWAEHDVRHPAVASTDAARPAAAPAGQPAAGAGERAKDCPACCRGTGKCASNQQNSETSTP